MIVITKLDLIEERASPSRALFWRSEAAREGIGEMELFLTKT